MACANYKHQKVFKYHNKRMITLKLVFAHVILFGCSLTVEGKTNRTSILIPYVSYVRFKYTNEIYIIRRIRIRWYLVKLSKEVHPLRAPKNKLSSNLLCVNKIKALFVDGCKERVGQRVGTHARSEPCLDSPHGAECTFSSCWWQRDSVVIQHDSVHIGA